MKIRKFIVFLFLIAAALITFFYIKSVVFDENSTESIVNTVMQDEVDITEGDTINIFVPESDMKHLSKKRVSIEKQDNERNRINEIFYALRDAEGSVISNRAEIKNIFRDGNKLYLNFNKEILNFNKDSSTEMMLIYSIVNTFCSYNGISKVKILVNNKETETLGGFINSKDFFERDMLLVMGD